MDSDTLFMGISVISWLLLLITGWLSFGLPTLSYVKDEKVLVVWLMECLSYNRYSLNSFNIHYVLFYMIMITTLLLSTAGFLVYMYSLFINKNDNVKNGMLGQITKFHFIPLLCISSLFIIGESLEQIDDIRVPRYLGIFFNIKNVHCAFNFIFDIIGLFSLIYIYLNTTISEPIYATYTINKGAYSCFIALLVYDFFYVFTLSGIITISEADDTTLDDLYDWLKGCGYAFSILIGVAIISLSLFLKDFLLAFINLLMHIGMVIHFFKLKDATYDIIYDGKGIGAILIIMMIISLASLCFLVIKLKPFSSTPQKY